MGLKHDTISRISRRILNIKSQEWLEGNQWYLCLFPMGTRGYHKVINILIGQHKRDMISSQCRHVSMVQTHQYYAAVQTHDRMGHLHSLEENFHISIADERRYDSLSMKTQSTAWPTYSDDITGEAEDTAVRVRRRNLENWHPHRGILKYRKENCLEEIHIWLNCLDKMNMTNMKTLSNTSHFVFISIKW